MDDLRKMARSPFNLVDQFIEQARRIIAEEPVSATAIQRIKQIQQRLIQETEEQLKTFRSKVAEKEQELLDILHSSVREDFATQALKAVHDLYRIIELWSLKEKLTRRWEDQPASALLADYQDALRSGDIEKVEIFEADAERFLARKADLEAMSKFMTLRAESLESRLTPAQKEAKAALNELNQLKEEVKVALCFLASTFRAYGGLVPLGSMWRKEDRHKLDQVDQRGFSLTVQRDGPSALPVTLVEFSENGLKIRASEMFPVGSILSLSLGFPGVTEQAVAFRGEVRWCREEPTQQGRYALGLRLVEGTETPVQEIFSTLLTQIIELDNLFSSLRG